MKRLTEEILIARQVGAEKAHNITTELWRRWADQPMNTQNTELIIIEILEAAEANRDRILGVDGR